ncbi:hypothetical protein HPB48_004787 [Haemaphysalis longicornis]|uniref:Uncharacterized protein n=1 Tax=Haemaphysalis longicornis TaxID=44386 RepID=A0A9J6FCY9_HAELO|nr:hypothetical protein HPB48_004787 [Haemaphysalis longicornis]
MALAMTAAETLIQAVAPSQGNSSAAWGHVATEVAVTSESWMSPEENSTAVTVRGNLSAEDYPPMNALGFELQAFLIALYSLTALLALGGNVMVIVVLVLGRRSSRELRLFLVNLALLGHRHGRVLHPVHLHRLHAGSLDLRATLLPGRAFHAARLSHRLRVHTHGNRRRSCALHMARLAMDLMQHSQKRPKVCFRIMNIKDQ